jgi:hypothetical protein
VNRYILVDYIKPKKGDITGTNEPFIFYLDMMAPTGERMRTALEPIAEEL